MEKKTSCKIGIAMTALVLAVGIFIGVVGCSEGQNISPSTIDTTLQTTETAAAGNIRPLTDLEAYYGKPMETDAHIIIKDIHQKFSGAGNFSMDITLYKGERFQTENCEMYDNVECRLVKYYVDTDREITVGEWNTRETPTAHFENLPFFFEDIPYHASHRTGYIEYRLYIERPGREPLCEVLCGTKWHDFAASTKDHEYVPVTELERNIYLGDLEKGGGCNYIEIEDRNQYWNAYPA